MTWVWIEPNDVWTFHDARAMSLGGGQVAQTLFPPTPLTVQGALRSLILGNSDVGWRAFREQSTEKAQSLGREIGYPAHKGRPAQLGAFQMAGPFLAYRGQNGAGQVQFVPYLPLPFDVRRTKDPEPSYFTLQPTRKHIFASNWPTDELAPLWPQQEEDFEEPEPLWLTCQGLRMYLEQDDIDNTSLLKAEDLFKKEQRLGIALNYVHRRPRQGMLYQEEFVRPQPYIGLLVRVADEVSFPAQRGTLRIGGEGRAAYYECVGTDQVIAPSISLAKHVRQFKVVLLTPAYFKGGWRPLNGDAGWSRLLGVGTGVRLIAAALGRPHFIGGWDVAQRGGRGWHKPMYAYVPAGSVFFFIADKEVPSPVGPLTETPEGSLPHEQLGFGQIAVGTWDWLS